MLGRDARGTTTGDAAEAYLVHRQYLLGRLARVDAALDQWVEYDAYDAGAREPRSRWRPPLVPTLPRMGLQYVHALLVEELAQIDGLAGC